MGWLTWNREATFLLIYHDKIVSKGCVMDGFNLNR
ncbi:hypothetical protein FBZ94_1023 [Bradyrhizobium sacchari]|uniref:Uncharacterized protein n=1 Tax=Bradyrhizobium sacchari TaxID=1399419 RepID=A0A560IZM0_9BRAD|nr:hypothetical protein FBZ94_1023 [Bradyrhizobium sacchari]TWB80786.1 hypothetical protein FBZ95_1023 [Bradyrhizobium sacchari]